MARIITCPKCNKPRQHKSRGLCEQCYTKEYYRENREKDLAKRKAKRDKRENLRRDEICRGIKRVLGPYYKWVSLEEVTIRYNQRVDDLNKLTIAFALLRRGEANGLIYDKRRGVRRSRNPERACFKCGKVEVLKADLCDACYYLKNYSKFKSRRERIGFQKRTETSQRQKTLIKILCELFKPVSTSYFWTWPEVLSTLEANGHTYTIRHIVWAVRNQVSPFKCNKGLAYIGESNGRD